MVMKERLPALRRWSSSFDRILGDARLSDVDAELEQLSVDPRRSPQRIGNAHLADKLAHLLRHSWSAGAPRLPAPERSVHLGGSPQAVVRRRFHPQGIDNLPIPA